MLKLYTVENEKQVVKTWSKYESPFEALDYALREGNGWLYTFGKDDKCINYGYYYHDELIGFSQLDNMQDGSAEFYIAIRMTYVNMGIGELLCLETLKAGFNSLHLDMIFLKVRKNHFVGIHLYRKLGFKITDEKRMIINERDVDFALCHLKETSILSKTLSSFVRGG